MGQCKAVLLLVKVCSSGDSVKAIQLLNRLAFFTKHVPIVLLNFFHAFTGATASTTVYPHANMLFWHFLLWMIPFAFLMVFILKGIGSAWRNKRKPNDEK